MSPQTPKQGVAPKFIFTPFKARLQDSDAHAFSSSPRERETALTQKLRSNASPTKPQLQIQSSDEIFDENDFNEIVTKKMVDPKGILKLTKTLIETISALDTVEAQEAHLYMVGTVYARLIQEGSLNPGLLNIPTLLFDPPERPEDTEGLIIVDDPKVSTNSKSSKKKKTNTTKGSGRRKKGNIDQQQDTNSTESSADEDDDDNEDDDNGVDITKTISTRLRGRKGAIKQPKTAIKSTGKIETLETLKMPLSATTNVQTLTEVRDNFMTELRDIRFKQLFQNRPRMVSLEEWQVVQWTNFLFHGLMSEKNLAHINEIIKSYNKTFDDDETPQTAAYARSQAAKMPDGLLKDLALSLASRTEARTTQGAYQTFIQYLADYKMAAAYHAALEALVNGGKQAKYRTYLASKNKKYKPSQGRSWATVLKQYFIENIWVVENETWERMMHQTAPIYRLVEFFGHGILLVLLKDHRHKLTHLTVSALDNIVPIFMRHCPDFVYAVDVLTETLFKGINDGDQDLIPQGKLNVSHNTGSFLVNVQSYVDPEHSIPRRAIEADDEDEDLDSEAEEEVIEDIDDMDLDD